MTVIKQEDLIQSVADALQYISYYHPLDYITSLGRAYELEQSPAAKDAIAQILTNSRMCAEGRRPICQDTGIVTVFMKVGMDVRWASQPARSRDPGVTDMVNEGVRRAYLYPENVLRASIVSPPEGAPQKHQRQHSGRHPLRNRAGQHGRRAGRGQRRRLGEQVEVRDARALGLDRRLGVENRAHHGRGLVSAGHARHRHRRHGRESDGHGEGIAHGAHRHPGGHRARTARAGWRNCVSSLYEKVNALGIGAQGLGGLATVLDVKILAAPTHAASKPVAIIPNCAATRHVHFSLDGKGPAKLEAPPLDAWPKVHWVADAASSRRVDLNTLTKEEVASWKPGQRLLLSGKMLTGRDAAHKRISDMLAKGEKLPVDFTNRVIYYVGPVDPVRDEAVGPAGPTTATRMDKFTELMLAKTGLIAMIGKAERGPVAIEAIKNHKAAYLMAVGGAAYLVSKAIRGAKVLAFEDLGMEAIYEFEVQDMPVTVAVDSTGTSVHNTGPKEWRVKIAVADRRGRPRNRPIVKWPRPARNLHDEDVRRASVFTSTRPPWASTICCTM